MSAAGVPPELRELIEVLAEAAKLLPCAADIDGWKHRSALEGGRWGLVRVRLQLLADELAIGDQYPSCAAEALARHCGRSVKKLRAELAKPLGYEVKGAAAEQPA